MRLHAFHGLLVTIVVRLIQTAIGLCTAAAAAIAQSGSPPLSFDAASVKPAAPGNLMVRGRNYPGRVEYTSFSLRLLIQRAYDVQDFQISGPDWMASTRFDVIAKLPEGVPASKVPELLQSLLAERFKLVAHRTTKEQPIYALVLAKNGPKMKEAAPGEPDAPPGGWYIRKSPGRIEGHRMNMASLVKLLGALAGRPVVDETGLKAAYDFDLDYVPEEGQPGADRDGVPLFSALQSQLGLRLDARKGPVEIIVVDQIERAPTEN